MLRIIVLSLSFLLSGLKPHTEPFRIMSALSRKDKWPNSSMPQLIVEVDVWNAVPKVMEADLNMINALKNEDGALEEELEKLNYGYMMDCLQIENSKLIMEEGLFGINGISAHAFANYEDADGECIRCTATRAKTMVSRELWTAQFMVVATCAAKQKLLRSQLQAGEAFSATVTHSNTGGLFSHGDSGLSLGGCEADGNSAFASAVPSFRGFTVVDNESVGNDVIANLLRKVLHDWGELEEVLTMQERVREGYPAIDRRIFWGNLLIGLDDSYGFMSREEHEPSMYSWGATISVINGRSLLQVNNSRVFTDVLFDAAVYTVRNIIERAEVKSMPLYLEVLSQSLHLRASCHGPGVNDSIRKFLGKRLHDYNQHQVTTALQATASKSSVYNPDTSSSDIQTYEHMTANTTDFMPRFVMRYYDRVSRNDGGDTMLIDESEPTDLVDATDTTYLMENGKTIYDGNTDVMMATVTSGTNGEPCTLVDVTSQVIPERMNVNAFNKCISIWGDLGEPWSADVMGQCWRDNSSTAVATWEDVPASSGNSSLYGEVPRDGIGNHGVIDVQSLVPTWHIEADGILSLCGLGPRRTMGRLTLQKTETNGDAICVKELRERYKRVQGSIKSIAVDGNSNFETLSECNETVGHSMTSNVWNPETREVLHRSRLRRATSSDVNHPTSDGNDNDPPPGPDDHNFEEGELDQYERGDNNGETGGNNSDNANPSRPLAREAGRHVGHHGETGRDDLTITSSRASLINGEPLRARTERTVSINVVQDAAASTGNHSLSVIYGNTKQQLVKRQHICADDTAYAFMQQLMGSASCFPCCRSVIMSILFANLHALSLITSIRETKLRIFAVRSDMIHGIGYCHGDVQHECWHCSYACLGFFVVSMLILRHAMGSHTIQIVDPKTRYDSDANVGQILQLAMFWREDAMRSASKGTLFNRLIRRIVGE